MSLTLIPYVTSIGQQQGLVYIFGAMAMITGTFGFKLLFALGMGMQGILVFYFHV
jgi:hypothetical protein